MNIILIVADTFRRDHLGCYGNSWIRTPNLDRLAEKSILFDRAYAASFPTMPNRADLLTGKYTFTYLDWAPLPEDEITLPALLSKAGYLTMGIVDTPFYVRNGYGYDRGFHDFVWIRGQRFGPEHADVARTWRYEEDRFAPTTLARAERWLEDHHKEKFFLLVDTWDPHEPWDPPDYYVEMYDKDHDGKPCAYPCYWDWKESGLTEADVKKAHAHFCGEITMVDRAIGRLLDRMESLDLMDDTVIIFTSDHGFYFGERGQFGKSRRQRAHEETQSYWVPDDKLTKTLAPADWYRSPLYDQVARIPLLVYVPKAKAMRKQALVSSPDLMPTILELARVEIPQTVQASSLVPLLHSEDDHMHNYVFSSWPMKNLGGHIRVVDDQERTVAESLSSTITDGEWSLIYATAGEPVELYHTASDPKQEQDIFEDNEAIAQELHVRFVKFLEEMRTDEVFLAPRRQLR